MTQPYMEVNLLISIKIINTFISKVGDIYIIDYYITLKENKATPYALTYKEITKIDC